MSGMPDEERPVWLPEGWIMRVSTREGGKKDRYYTSPSSGYICRSKPEVMRYIDIEKNDGQATRSTSCFGDSKQQMFKELDSQATRSSSCFGDNKQQPTVQIGNSPEWLPSGWIMEIRTRKSGAKAGFEYKCYFDPCTGYRFYSKGEVFRYLESGELRSSISNPKRSIKTNSTSDICTSSNQRGSIHNKFTGNVVAQIEYSSDGLPNGWIKEIRVRKTNTEHKVRKDPYYIDPVSGYVFRSRKDVFHYIETGEVGKYAFKPRKKHMNNMYSLEKESPPPIAAKKRILRKTVVRRCLFSGRVPNSNVKTVIKNDELPEKPDLPLQFHPSARGMEGADSSCLTPSNVEHLGKGIENQPNPVGTFPQPASPKPLDETAVYPSEGKELEMLNEKLPKTEELENVRLLQPGNGELQLQEDKLSEERQLEVMNETPPPQQAYRKLRRGRKKRRGRKIRASEDQVGSQKQGRVVQLRPRRTISFKAITLPVRSSKRLAGIKADPVVDAGVRDLSRRAMAKKSEPLRAKPARGSDQSGESHQTSGRSNELTATRIIGLEFLEKLEGKEPPGEQAEQVGARKPSDDRPESPLVLPFGDSWPDPCIEFAFKTLTGDIPVLEDTAAIQDYFQQQLISVQSPSLSGSSALTFSNPVSFSQPELHVQHSVHERRACSAENGLQSGRKANNNDGR